MAGSKLVVDDVTVLVLKSTTHVVLSGGVVTDGGAANSKVNVTACRYVWLKQTRIAPAVALLAVTDGQHVVVDPGDNTIKAAADATGKVDLATCADAAGVITPTAARRMLDTVTA